MPRFLRSPSWLRRDLHSARNSANFALSRQRRSCRKSCLDQETEVSSLSSKLQPILPGATVGVLGSGQLGRMFAIAARRMGYHVHTFSPQTDTPTGQVADVEINAPYDDLGAVREFARAVSV